MLLQKSWYLDDGILAGTEAELMHSFDILESEGKDLCFNVQISKCLLWLPQTIIILDQNIKHADPEGFEVLGAPFGTETHAAKVLSKRVEKTEPLLDRLQKLDHAHAAYDILKIFIGTLKMLCSLRTVKPSPSVIKLLLHFDNAQRDCLETLIKGKLTCSNWKQANLPIKLVGLGLGCSSDQHLAVSNSSVKSVSSTVEALIWMKPTLENEVNANWLEVDRRIQKKIQEQFDQKSLNDLSQAINVREGAWLQSPLAPNAGAWKITAPISALGLHLEVEEFQSCIKYRLGIPIYNAPRTCCYCKNGVIDLYGDHSLTSGGQADFIYCHDRLIDKVFSSCVSANLSTSLEKKNLSSNNQYGPADVFLPSWTQGKPAALDVAVVSALQSTIIEIEADTPSYALTYADDRKLAAHDADCREAGVKFFAAII